MGKKSSKATKKFQKSHLSRELTQRKHDQKKKAIREKGMAKYVEEHAKGGPAPQKGEEEEEEEEDELAVPEAARSGAEREVFTAKAKLKPSATGAHKLDRRPASTSASSASTAAGYTKPPSKKAPSIEDLDGAEEAFLDAAYLDDDAAPQVDQAALEDGEDDDEEDEDGDAAMGSDDDGEGEDDAADTYDADADAAEGDAESAALLAEIEAHEAELANLATTDPEFYSHLKQHDKALLDFNKEEEMADDAEDEEDAERDERALADDQAGGKKELEVLDWASLKALQAQVIGPVWSLRALKKLIRIFRGAVHIGEISSKKGGKVKAISEKQAEKDAAFRQEARIDSPRVYNELIRFTLKESHKIWAHHFKPEGAAAGGKGKKDSAAAASSPAVFAHLDKHAKWSTLGPVLKAFLGHVLHFLTSLHANPRMARFALGALEPLVILLDPFPKLAAKVLRELLAFWSQAEKDVRIDAFLRIRQMAIELSSTASRAAGGESMLELVLKGIYLTYVRNSKFSGELTLPVIEFMANCVVELYGLEPTLAYQYAFVYIRQCAIHLRTALLAKKKDSHRAVYNWNFINCLRVWGKVLAVQGVSNSNAKDAGAAQDNLSALVYPYVQICLGTLGVMQSSRYFPLRFHVVRMLIDLARSVSIFVPLAPYLLAVLHAPELSKKPTSSTKKQSDIAFILKVSPGILATKACQEVFVAEALSLLLSYFELYAHSIAFPEMILPALKILRKTQKDIVVHRIRKQIQGLILKLEHNASWIVQKRNGTSWTPKDMNERKKGVEGLRTFDAKMIGSESYGAAIGGGKAAGPAANQQAPLTKYVSVAFEERRKIDEAKADWDGSRGSRNEPKSKKGSASKGSDDEDEEEERQEQYDRKNRGGDDDEEDDEDEEGEGEDDEDDGEDEEEDDDDEDDAPKSKKARKDDAASAAPRNPFSYPTGLDAEVAEGEGDMLAELAFSDDDDDDDEAPKRKQKKQQPKSKPSKSQAKSAPKPAANGVKKEGGAGSQKKPQQQQQKKQQAGKRKRD